MAEYSFFWALNPTSCRFHLVIEHMGISARCVIKYGHYSKPLQLSQAVCEDCDCECIIGEPSRS